MESRIRRSLLAQVRDIPTLPTILFRILDLTSDHRTSADDVADAIHSDHALAAKILRMINSAYYGLQHKISNIRHAVAMLGFRALKNIVLSISIHETLIRDESKGGLNKPLFWQHALATGGAAYQIARSLSYPEPEEAYTAGLLHDIGKIVLDKYMKEAYFKVLSHPTVGTGPHGAETEGMVLGVTHAEVGGLVAEKWNFPPTLTEAIRRHHDRTPDAFPTPRERQLAAIVALADFLAWDRGYGSVPCDSKPRPPDWVIQTVPLESLDLEWLYAEMDTQLARASEIFGLAAPSSGPHLLASALDEAPPPAPDVSGIRERISQELESRALEISLVGEVVDRIRRMDDVDEIIRSFLVDGRSRLHFDRVFYLRSDTPNRLKLTYVLDKAGLRFPRQENILVVDESSASGPIENAALTGQPFLASIDADEGRDDWIKGAREMGGTPLSTSERLLGVVVVDNSITGSPITEMAVQTLHLLALEVGMVIEKQSLLERYRDTERLARTDELTGLANRRHALAVIDREMRKSRHRASPLCLVLIDLDHFKAYNDRFGHEVGDRILKGVAERMGKRCREHDTVARLGGDEYAIILPETGIDEARLVACRILEDVETWARELQVEFPGGALSLSGGIALFDPELDDPKRLMKRADDALYSAKNDGRGRIVAASSDGTTR